MKTYDFNNYRQIRVKFVAPTNHRGARVKIYEPKRYNDDKVSSVTLSYSYEVGDIEQQAINYLIDKGFNIVCRASDVDAYILLCDNWGDNFIEL